MAYPDAIRLAQLLDLFPHSTNMGQIALINDPSATLTETSNTAAWTALETNYYGSARQTFTTPSSGNYAITTTPSRKAKFSVTVEFNNTAGASPIVYTHVILITGSTLLEVWDFPGGLINAGASRNLVLEVLR